MTVGHRPPGSASRSFSMVIVVAMVLALVPLSGLAFAAHSEEEPHEGRFENTVELEADSNVEAAIEWSQFTFADGSAETAALGRSDLFPDNLASSLIQGQEDAPLLLTPTNELDERVEAELQRLGVDNVHVLGGDEAIAESVVDELEAAGYNVHRDAGITRIETAIDIAATHAPNATTGILTRAFGGPSGDETQAWADTLAAGAWAADEGWPVFLTQSEELNDNLREYLEDSAITTLYVIGGTSAISATVVAELEAMGIQVNRVAGANRFQTATEVAEERGFDDASDADTIILVEGQAQNAWASGFAAAAYADMSNAPIVLSNGENLPPETEAWFLGTDADDDNVNDNIVTGEEPLLVCGPFTNDAACAEAAALLGYPEAPTTPAAETFITDRPELIAAEAGGSFSEGTRVVRYYFDSDIVGTAIATGNFHLYSFDGTRYTAQSTRAVTGNASAVDAVFDDDEVGTATLATVALGAVQDADGDQNPEGDIALQAVTLQGGITEDPDLLSVSLDATDDEVTFVFDEAVDTNAAGDAFEIVLEDGTPIPGAGPVQEDPDNENAVIVTFAGLTAAQVSDVVRAIAEEGAVTAEDDGDTNPLESVAVSNNGNDVNPSLVSATVDSTTDQVRYTFSESVATADPNAFYVTDFRGNTAEGDTATVSGNTVTVDFADDELDETLVLAQIDELAVTATQGGAANTAEQSRPLATQSFQAGQTAAPELIDAQLIEDLDPFGQVEGHDVLYTFDEDVETTAGGNFVVYLEDGERVVLTGCTIDPDNTGADETVRCDVTDEDAGTAVLATVEYAAVLDTDEPNDPNFPSGRQNPEGAEGLVDNTTA